MAALFIYWRVSPDHAAAALESARRWRDRLRQSAPEIDMRLYLRRDEQRSDGAITVMETYSAPAGSDSGWIQAIQTEAAAAMAGCAATRHVEVFEPLDDLPPAG